MPCEKNENGIVARSEESITLMTSYRLPHHGNRSFAVALDDILPPSSPRVQIFTFVQDDTLPSYTRIMKSAVRRSPLVYVVRLIEDTRSP